MNSQSKGTLTLASADSADLPLIDSNSLSHPYDRRIAIEAVRFAVTLSQESALKDKIQRNLSAPTSLSDEDIWVGASEIDEGKYTSQEYH